ncbi:hypothetical protein TNCV_2062321 [Trichonephila clavipes]|nr:hypothetical protein TNCV_2062321 [Trichonephila clavipes]
MVHVLEKGYETAARYTDKFWKPYDHYFIIAVDPNCILMDDSVRGHMQLIWSTKYWKARIFITGWIRPVRSSDLIPMEQ